MIELRALVITIVEVKPINLSFYLKFYTRSRITGSSVKAINGFAMYIVAISSSRMNAVF